VRVLEGDRLGDHPAHRRADDVRLLDAEGVEHAHRVGRHVAERVARARRVAGEGGGEVGHGAVLDLRRQADVAVVVDDDVEAAVGEQLPEVGVPGDQLRAEPHDEQQRRIGRITGGLVLDRDPVHRRARHGGHPTTRPAAASRPRRGQARVAARRRPALVGIVATRRRRTPGPA
jgi:hypothetical protein